MFLISYGICAEDHTKPGAPALTSADIFEMLATTMRMANPERVYPEAVSVTGLASHIHVPSEIARRATILARMENPGHQQGAAWNIAAALRYAYKNEHSAMLHVGGDIVPESATMARDELALLAAHQADYVAGRWGKDGAGVGTQGFICRPAAFFDREGECLVKLSEIGPTLEYYMGGLINRHGLKLVDHNMQCQHIHDLAEFRVRAQKFFQQREGRPSAPGKETP
jgi:hypothetical protein